MIVPQGFIDEIVKNPGSAASRCALADWLVDRGESGTVIKALSSPEACFSVTTLGDISPLPDLDGPRPGLEPEPLAKVRMCVLILHEPGWANIFATNGIRYLELLGPVFPDLAPCCEKCRQFGENQPVFTANGRWLCGHCAWWLHRGML